MGHPVNMAVLAVLALLALILVCICLLYYGAPPTLLSGGAETLYCHDGDIMACAVGPCNGLASCIGGVWSGCRWERVCMPGSTKICQDQLCPSGIRECNQCGTGYGPCRAP